MRRSSRARWGCRRWSDRRGGAGRTSGTPLLLDGDAGTVTVAPTEQAAQAALARRARQQQRAQAALARAHEPGRLLGGEPIEVFANIGSVRDAARAVELGAEGVGLLRTEFLFLDRPTLPDERSRRRRCGRSRVRWTGGRWWCARSTRVPTSRCRRCRCRPSRTRSWACAHPPGAHAGGAARHPVPGGAARRRRVPGEADAADGRHARGDPAGAGTAGAGAAGDGRGRTGRAGDHGRGPGRGAGGAAAGAPRRLLLGRDQRPDAVHDGRRARRRAARGAAGEPAAGGCCD